MRHMRAVFLLVILGLFPAAALAQGPGFAPYPAPVMDPAYRHFLNSPYSYRAISGPLPGYAETRVSPFGYDSFYVTPGRVHQRITPYGFESEERVPGISGASLSPWGYGAYYTPGYTHSYYWPRVVIPWR
jgi:hypothetical protein